LNKNEGALDDPQALKANPYENISIQKQNASSILQRESRISAAQQLLSDKGGRTPILMSIQHSVPLSRSIIEQLNESKSETRDSPFRNRHKGAMSEEEAYSDKTFKQDGDKLAPEGEVGFQ